jgi:transcription termination factor Rho
LKAIHRLRRMAGERKPREAMELLLERMEKTSTNAEFLKTIG